MKEFLKFIENTPTAFHAAKAIKSKLLQEGFIELKENEIWSFKNGGKYFFGRNMSSLVAFVLPKGQPQAFNITAAHLDSPTFKLKPNFTIERNHFVKLNTEVYGGPIYTTWMDRPLGIAGRVIIQKNNQLEAHLVNIRKPIAVIPNMPIHYNREVNKGVELNPQVDMLPLIGDRSFGDCDLYSFVASELGIAKESILSSDLYLTNLDRGCFVGLNEEYIMGPQLDNLECSYGLIEGLLQAEPLTTINVCVLFDNEEIGSSTMQGAGGNMLELALKRISYTLGLNEEEYLKLLANSFIVSADNAQGVHPNHIEKFDETNACYLNGGIVIKNAARGSYSTDAMSSAYFQKLCKSAGVQFQLNTNRSDILGGSTLGVISLRHISIPSVDIGLAQLAMHSAYETAGSYDLKELIKVIKKFYETANRSIEEEIIYS